MQDYHDGRQLLAMSATATLGYLISKPVRRGTALPVRIGYQAQHGDCIQYLLGDRDILLYRVYQKQEPLISLTCFYMQNKWEDHSAHKSIEL